MKRCGCDYCQGIVWPEPQPITKFQKMRLQKMMGKLGYAMRKHADEYMREVLNEKNDAIL